MISNKKTFMCIILSFLCIFSCFGLNNHDVLAKEKVTKVTHKIIMTDNYSKGYMIVKGLSAKKHTVWTFKTKKHFFADTSPLKCVVKNNRVYVFDNTKLYILSKNTGKKMHTVKKVPGHGHMVSITNSYTCYVIGYNGENRDRLYKISSKGKIIWKSKDISDENFGWATNVKIKDKKIIVECCYLGNHSMKPAKLYFDSKTGSIIKKEY
ncbi:MAG: hypothetical protein PUE67_02100 [Oscillospiraceae bacterium]|nr:hypothetical protein [Oscillospiraceae bacterium]